MVDSSTCTKCKGTKPVSAFHRTKYNRRGIQSWCKACIKAAARAGYLRDRKKAQQRVKDRRQQCPEYDVWISMKRRAYKTDRNTVHNYRDRGISVCDKWKDSFAAFYRDMGPRPTPQHMIDRIDNNGDYTPENCRWATPAEQSRNTRRNRFLTVNGETKCITDWARLAGISTSAIRERIRRGWSAEIAVSPDVVRGRPNLHGSAP